MTGPFKIRVVSDIDRIVANLDDAAKRQVPFAIARALTMTARDAQGDVRAELPSHFTLRNNWTSSGIRITPATKSSPEAIVGSLEPYMQRQETGGTRTARDHSRVAVPVKAKRNKRDRIPKGQRPAAMKGKPRVLLINGSNIIQTKGGQGILQRVGRERYPLQVVYWMKRGVKIKPRFGFKATTFATIAQRFGPNLTAALSQAMGHMG